MLRAMFVEYPSDPVAWMVEDQYQFGSDILVAPIFEGDDEYSVPTAKVAQSTKDIDWKHIKDVKY